MLAPGDYVLKPAEDPPPGQAAAPPADRGGDPTGPTEPPGEVKEPEPESFLLILLRALGAIHT